LRVSKSGVPAPRERNRRGEGGKLRAEILAAATEILEQTGSEESVTLRAVARRAGISAPSIYAHFVDRDAIVDAIVDDAFTEFFIALQEATVPVTDPVARLRAGCAAYLAFARERPNRYRLLFQRRNLLDTDLDARPMAKIRTDGFDLLVNSLRDCVEAGASTSDDLLADATAMWVAMHGFATLRAELTIFPWLPDDAMLDRIDQGLGHVRPSYAIRGVSLPPAG
jgi:AcrR family transcriptional regulator